MSWLNLLDLCGVFVFALSGGFDGARYRLDAFGVLVLAVATGVGGGIIRDILLGEHPPLVFSDHTYVLICLCAGFITLFFSHRVHRHFYFVKLADAVGLGVFAAIGASKAAAAGLGWVGILMISIITATGGGVIRDLLVREIPMILRADFYALAALIGGSVFILCSELGLAEQWVFLFSISAAIISRLIAIKYDVSIPQARGSSYKNQL